MPFLKLVAQNVSVEYHIARTSEHFVALDNVNLEINEGEFVSFLGPSGCGKTTFLNAIDGLIPITHGEIRIDGQNVTKPGNDRAMVFQSSALLPWRTVMGNVMYGLELQGRGSDGARTHAEEMIKLIGLEGFENRF